MRPLRFTPWVGSSGVVATVNLDPVPVNAVLAAIASAAIFSGAATVASGAGVSGVLSAVAQASSFAGAATVATGGGGDILTDGGLNLTDGGIDLENA